MDLGKLLQSVMITGTLNLDLSEAIEINKITDIEDQTDKNSIFVAIKGKHFDGNSFIKDAYQRGCKVCFVEHFNEEVPIMQIRVPDTRVALSKLSATYFDFPSKKLDVIGITATNGKTTMSFMLDEILKQAKLKTGVIGSIKIKGTEKLTKSDYTTPKSFELQGYLKDMLNRGVEVVTMEVSSLALEQKRANDIDFKVVSFSNFNREHIDEHGSLEIYLKSKSSLITESSANSIAVLNYDDEVIRNLKGQGKAKQVFYSMENENADIFVKNINLERDNPSFTLTIKKEIELKERVIKSDEFEIYLGVPGFHSVKNAIACASMALVYGIDKEAIIKGLKAFRGIERRFELLYNGKFKIIDDHFANEENINVTLDSISKMKYNNLHIVYAIRGNRGITVNRENLNILKDWEPKIRLKTLMGTQTLGEVTEKDKVSEEELEIYKTYSNNLNAQKLFENDLETAIEKVIDLAQEGDIVLLAGSQGMDLGGRKAIHYVASKEYQGDVKEKVLSVLDGRICG